MYVKYILIYTVGYTICVHAWTIIHVHVHMKKRAPKFSIFQALTWNSREKIKSTIPCEQYYAAWLVKNSKTLFSKLTRKISLLVSGEHVSQHLVSSFPFSDFCILSSLFGFYFSGISCTFQFWQMFNGFLTSTFQFYWSLALQLSCITVRLSEGRYRFPVAID